MAENHDIGVPNQTVHAIQRSTVAEEMCFQGLCLTRATIGKTVALYQDPGGGPGVCVMIAGVFRVEFCS